MTDKQDVTDATFAESIARTDAPTLVDFWAPWCGPCRLLAPVLYRAAEHYGDRLHVVRLNVDDSPVSPSLHDVRSIPTLILFREGQPVARMVGLVRFADLTALLDSELTPAGGPARA